MLKPAFAFKNELNAAILETVDDPHFYPFHADGWMNYEVSIDDSDWGRIQRVSVDKSGMRVIGFFDANLFRSAQAVSNLLMVNFTKKPSPTFSKDLLEFLDLLLVERKFRKINWKAVADSPADLMYARLAEKGFIRLAGTFLSDTRLMNGEYADMRLYEMFAGGYRNWRKK